MIIRHEWLGNIVIINDEIFGCDTHLGWIIKWKGSEPKKSWLPNIYSIKRK